MLISPLLSAQNPLPQQQPPRVPAPDSSDDEKLPNGKSQKDAIAKQQHEQALKDTNNLITVAEELKDELQKAGDYVVPLSSVKKTEEIEKLARRIRGRLKQ
jgi:Zn-dependent oligopeptidase